MPVEEENLLATVTLDEAIDRLEKPRRLVIILRMAATNLGKRELIAGVAEGIFAEVARVKAGLLRVKTANLTDFMAKGDGGLSVAVVVSKHIAVGVSDDTAVTTIVRDERNLRDIFRKILGKIDKIVHIRAGETINCLPVVANGKEMRRRADAAQSLDETEEKVGKILVFVHEDILQRSDAALGGVSWGRLTKDLGRA